MCQAHDPNTQETLKEVILDREETKQSISAEKKPNKPNRAHVVNDNCRGYKENIEQMYFHLDH